MSPSKAIILIRVVVSSYVNLIIATNFNLGTKFFQRYVVYTNVIPPNFNAKATAVTLFWGLLNATVCYVGPFDRYI